MGDRDDPDARRRGPGGRRWRVDSAPLPARLLIHVLGVLTATAIGILWGILKLTVRVEHVGRPAGFGEATHIACAWHEALIPYFVAAMPYPRPYVWMNHPLWYMRGIHLFLRWMGVRRLVLGSSGHGGQAALATLVAEVRDGLPTFLNPDGPHGPARHVKDGVLILSEQTGAPIVALRVECSRAIRLPTWDRKLLPLPGSRITVSYGEPLRATPSAREACRAAVARYLGGA
ncbi:MAG TPA: DUF374 domain-containing protein [Anaeromyxobacteraceae bacterium]|nr:DUF374 domain-containing protein [Anaeromyxobacteraceae bacterium]